MSGVANMQRGIDSIGKLRATIKDLPRRIQAAVAQDSVGRLSLRTRESYESGRTVYDTPRPVSVDKNHVGQALTLKKTGATERSFTFVAIGSIIRSSLGTKYAKYLIGRYKVLPQKLPALWRADIEQVVAEYAKVVEQEGIR